MYSHLLGVVGMSELVTILAVNIVCYKHTSTKLYGMSHDMF